ncbi:MAG: YeiH family protein, partial [Gemmatimonadales bacterium]
IKAGLPLVASIVGVVIAAIVTGAAIGRALGLSPVHALLVACGNAICGNSAIAALAPVLGARKDEVASAIAYTAVLGVVVILGLPFLAPLFGLNDYQYGVLAGLTVYAVPQVIAAAYPVSLLAGQTATLVKLVRVLMLGPLVVVLSVRRRRVDAALAGAGIGELLPWFVVGFIVAGALRSSGVVSLPFADSARDSARVLTVLAMAALGLNVDIHAIRKVGPRVAATVTGSLLVMVTIALVIVRWIPR